MHVCCGCVAASHASAIYASTVGVIVRVRSYAYSACGAMIRVPALPLTPGHNLRKLPPHPQRLIGREEANAGRLADTSGEDGSGDLAERRAVDQPFIRAITAATRCISLSASLRSRRQTNESPEGDSLSGATSICRPSRSKSSGASPAPTICSTEDVEDGGNNTISRGRAASCGPGDFIGGLDGSVSLHPALAKVLVELCHVEQRRCDDEVRWLKTLILDEVRSLDPAPTSPTASPTRRKR